MNMTPAGAVRPQGHAPMVRKSACDRRGALRSIVAFCTVALADPASADPAATRLAQSVYDRPAGRDATTVSRMELTERDRSPRVRELVSYRLDRGDGVKFNLVRFTQPEDIEGTGLLSLNQVDGTTDQWLYLPALDRARRVAGDRKGCLLYTSRCV